MRLRILGPLEAEVGGKLVDLGGARQRQLVALLLLHGGLVPTERLIEELWSGDPPKTARHTVQTYVHRMRKALGSEGQRLETLAVGYRLSLSAEELDALAFEARAKEGRRALTAGDAERAAARLGEALALWRGGVLSDVPDLQAFEPERARLEGLRLSVLEDRSEADLAQGRHGALVAELEELVAQQPFRERLWGQLMVALYRSDRQADALDAFRRVSELLDDELGIDPGPRLVELEGQILLQDPRLVAPQPEPSYRPPGSLPVARTSFVGRRRELAELEGLLRSRRLVTLTGPPGVGKTRLALETAHRVEGEHAHGVFFVSLAEVETPALLSAVISATLGVPASDQPLDSVLMVHLRPRRVLLMLDNFEHVAAGAKLVGRLLDAAPGLVVLATSRTPLHLSGEQEYPLGPLPAAAYDEVAANPADVDALTLFVDRARAVDPDFTLTADNGPEVAEVVNRLDRLPLAIELAAPRLRGVPLVELNAQLSSRLLAGLAGGPIDAPARQRTLAAAIDWSHDLLDPAAQAALRRLAVFRGGFTLEAAAAVIAGPPIEDVGSAISRLVDASLVERPVEVGVARFALLETIREYALERLEMAGETGTVLRRHADFCAQLVAQAEHELTGPAHHEWLTRLTAEYANVRAVLTWAGRAEPGDRDLALLMAGGLWRFWQLRGRLTEGRHWLEELLGSADDIAGRPRVKALIGLGWVCYWLADLDAAETSHRRALGLLDRLDDPWLRAEALFGVIITLACHRAQVETAMPFETQLQALIANHPHPVLVLLGIVSSGTLRRFGGDLEGARTLALEGVALTRKGGNRWWEGEALRALGQISFEQGRHEEAEEHLRESLALGWEIGHRTGVAIDLDWLARVAVARGRPAAGVVLAAAASRLRERLGGAFTVQDYRSDLEAGEVAARRMLTEPEFDRAWAQGQAMHPGEAVAYARAFTDMTSP